MYAVITVERSSPGIIRDLEFLDEVPTFPNRIEESEDAFPDSLIRVFEGNVNGGDSVELHWNGRGWVS